MAGEVVLKQLIDDNRQDIVQRLPGYMRPEQFFQLLYAADRNPALLDAIRRNPQGFIAAVLKAADCGLVPGTAYEHCWFIPYKDRQNNTVDIQLQIGWRGLVYQLVRAGAVLKIAASCVYEGDLFKLELGDEERLVHEPNLRDENRRNPKWLFDKNNILGAYAVAWLPDPLRRLKQYRWCPIGEIEAARAKSKVPDGPAWSHNYPAMSIKTAVRRVSKLIEVCGPTDENREAWERYGRTIELEKSEYKNHDDDGEDEPDLPGDPPPSGRKPSGRRAEKGEAKTADAPPSAQNGEKKASPPPPPPPPPVDEPISEDMQNKLYDLAKLSGVKLSGLIRYVREKYGLPSLEGLKESQATEVEKYLKSAS